MTAEFTGIVKKVFPTKSVGSKGFKKRDFWLMEETDSKWENVVPFVLKKDKCAIADEFSEGDTITVKYALDGRVWEKGDGSAPRCFCDLVCLSAEVVGREQGTSNKYSVPEPAVPPSNLAGGDDDTDMPF